MAKTSKAGGGEVPIVSPQLIDGAKDFVLRSKPVRRVPCRVPGCGVLGATERSDGLCWVCQHLKISAWRDSAAQESASE
jgi:hypothetical protein